MLQIPGSNQHSDFPSYEGAKRLKISLIMAKKRLPSYEGAKISLIFDCVDVLSVKD